MSLNETLCLRCCLGSIDPAEQLDKEAKQYLQCQAIMAKAFLAAFHTNDPLPFLPYCWCCQVATVTRLCRTKWDALKDKTNTSWKVSDVQVESPRHT